MKKAILLIGLILALSACTNTPKKPYKNEKPSAEGKKEATADGAAKTPKNQVELTKQANKVKCQVARLDLVDAEADGDINMIRQVKARVHNLCVVAQE